MTIYGCCGKAGGGALVAPSSLPDATDRWLTVADFQAGSGATTAQSWIILHNAILGVYLVIATIGGTSYLSWFLTKTAPTLNATPTYIPTMVNASGYDNDSQFITVRDGSAVRRNLHVKASTEGHFIALVTRETSTDFETIFGVFPVEPSRAADTNTLTSFRWSWAILGAAFAPAAVSSLYNTQGNFRTWKPLATTAVDCIGLEYYSRDGNYPMNDVTTDAADGKANDLPLYLHTNTAGSKGIKGRVIDIAWAPYGLADGDTDPASGSVTSMVAGPLWIPATAAIVW